jgi:beta-exotoxin I transport system ATP-binding protein
VIEAAGPHDKALMPEARPAAVPQPTAEQLLGVHGLVKHYGSVEAVRGIDLELHRGEILGFLGPNGAGKSTTIRCILDLLHPTAGTVEVFGLDPHTHGVEIRRRIAYVPGELRLPERMTGAQLVASLGRMRGGLDLARRDELAERLKLDLSRRTRQLSSGNRRKLALLLAFLWKAELLILDEPTSGLDPLMQHEFVLLLREARDAGASVFLSSHVLSEVQRTADRVVVLRAGKVVAQGTVDELRGRVRQRIEVWFDGVRPDGIANVPGLEDLVIEDHRFTAHLSGPVQPVLRFLADKPVKGLLAEEPDLEEAFLDLYEEQS